MKVFYVAWFMHCLLVLALVSPAHAQSLTWQEAFSGNNNQAGSGTSVARATALDASGNVYVTGSFTGQVTFSGTTLASVGGQDVFVAKWDARARSWAWAVAGGGTADDVGQGIAVGGGEVYVTGYVTNSGVLNASTTQNVRFSGTPLNSASTTTSANFDVFVARYSDGATAPLYRWATAGGGTSSDLGNGIAVSGSEVYVTGQVTNSGTVNTSTTQGVQFGGTPLYSASTTTGQNQDVFVARYSDGLPAPTYRWAAAGGGTGNDSGYGIAVNGDEVYLTGSVINSGTVNASTARAVQFGGSPLYSASTTSTASNDVFVARYSDGATAPLYRWAVAGGGTSGDIGNGITVSGNEVYVTGFVQNSGTVGTNTIQNVQFGNTPLYSVSTTSTANADVFVARYSDGLPAPTYRWAVAGGGTGADVGYGLAVSGGEVYVTGAVTNSGLAGSSTSQAVRFGGTLLYSASNSPTASNDVFVARYSDGVTAPTYRWAVTGGGPNSDVSFGIATNGSTVYTAVSTGVNVGSYGSILAPARAAGLGQLGSAGDWQRLEAPLQGADSRTQATALDASGNVYVTGFFTGQVAFGNTRLVSAGGQDVFVAKWDATARAWAWAAAGGGTTSDVGQGIAVSGTDVYVTGYVSNSGSRNSSTDLAVQFGGLPLYSASNASSTNLDVFVARYSTAGALQWVRAGGGTGGDLGYGIAVSGGDVYVTGQVTNSGTVNTSTAQNVQFGGLPLYSAGTTTNPNPDAFVVRYNAAGVAQWVAAGGSSDADLGYGIATNGTDVYVTGYVINGVPETGSPPVVQFGGVPLRSTSTTSSADIFVARYSAAGACQWAVAGGGTSGDVGYGIAVSGTDVYVTGQVTNSGTVNTSTAQNVQFGSVTLNSASTTASANSDVFVASYNAAGTCQWAVAGGGSASDAGYGIAVDGTQVYVTGQVTNSGSSNSTTNLAVQFGGTPLNSASTTPNANFDVFATRYSTAGAYQGAVAGGGINSDTGYGIAASGSAVYVAGQVIPTATFGASTLNNPYGTGINFVGRLTARASLTSVSPAAELPGQVVTLTGTGFTGGSTVSFGSIAASTTFVSATHLLTVVPAGLAAGSAPVSVTTGGTATTAQPFTVLEVYNGGVLGACTTAVPATASVGDGQWHYLLSSGGQVVAAYQYTSPLILGDLALDVLRADPGQPVRQDSRSQKYLDRNWHLTASGGRFEGRTVGLRLYGLNTEQSRLQNADPAASLVNLQASQYSGANEDCELTNNDSAGESRLVAAALSSPVGSAYFVAELAVADHFSEFYLTSSATPLPVRLTHFTATISGAATVRLAWATASEVNSQSFEVERSADGVTFGKIGTLAAAGHSVIARTYVLLDGLLPVGATTLYYRLRQVEQDGKAYYSAVRPVTLVSATAGLNVYPNPTRGGAVILVGAQPGTVATVLDALGRLVTTVPVNAMGTATLALPQGLATGVYVVRVGSQALRLLVE